MHHIKVVLCLASCVAVVSVGVRGALIYMKNKNVRELKIAFAGHWKNVHPGLQHTLIGDLTLSNQFEALVGFNENGVYVPLTAKGWTVSSDYRVFTFKIDTNRKFSDGAALSAAYYKESWENALRLEPKSSNSSLLDILYKVEGFSDFKTTGALKGLTAINNDTLEIRFTSPFRMALEHLSGNRFSAYREVDGKFLGTGAYTIDEIGSDTLRLNPNPHFSDPPQSSILLQAMKMSDALSSLEEGNLDVIAFAMGSALPQDVTINKDYSVIVGQDALHRAVYTNNQKGRLFEDKKYRRAFQFLLYEYLKIKKNVLGNQMYNALDFQVYLPLQSGRLSTSEVESIIADGERYVDDFRLAARMRPPVLIETADNSIKSILVEIGITISNASRTVDKSTIIDIIYKGEEADIIPGSFGVASGDPDGIYHKLGRSGAIASPMTRNESVEVMLEEGRRIIDKDKLDSFYQGVNRRILEEAPLIHLGFSKAVAIYRNDKVRVRSSILRRNEGHLYVFEAR